MKINNDPHIGWPTVHDGYPANKIKHIMVITDSEDGLNRVQWHFWLVDDPNIHVPSYGLENPFYGLHLRLASKIVCSRKTRRHGYKTDHDASWHRLASNYDGPCEVPTEVAEEAKKKLIEMIQVFGQ